MEAHVDGIVGGRCHLSLANEGDGLFHLACFEVAAQLETFQAQQGASVPEGFEGPGR